MSTLVNTIRNLPFCSEVWHEKLTKVTAEKIEDSNSRQLVEQTECMLSICNGSMSNRNNIKKEKKHIRAPHE